MNMDTCQIDGFGPLPVIRPSSVAQLGEIVRRASAEGAAVYPLGGQTQMGLGNPPIKAGLAVDVRGLDRVVDFPARDMTITVEAGVTVARLDEITRAEGLHLPIDVPDPERAIAFVEGGATLVTSLMAAFVVDYVVIGGGNAKHVKELPPGARLGHNLTAFRGGFRLWSVEDAWVMAAAASRNPTASSIAPASAAASARNVSTNGQNTGGVGCSW